MQISHLKYSIFKINSAVPFYVLEQIRIKDKIRHPFIREVVTMQGETYVIIALILALASGERTECRWSAEYLCGDKCLKKLQIHVIVAMKSLSLMMLKTLVVAIKVSVLKMMLLEMFDVLMDQHIIGELHAMEHASNMPNMDTRPYLVMIKNNV